MAGKRGKSKKGKKDESPSARDYSFRGGHWDGATLRLSNRPMPYVRFAIPVWETYELDPDGLGYHSIGDVPVPRAESESQAQREPWVTGLGAGQVNAAEEYVDSEAYQRGVVKAEAAQVEK